ncbi:MAG TPA: TonB-dependent receptor [Vicinamibacterales bacterium]|nr:TonB-dependent receptor [Vicinamibacterales bacterium]
MRSSTSLSICLGLLLLGASPAYAQFTTASFGGSVVDSNNGALPQSQVVVRNVDTGFTQTATTDERGAFLFPRLPVGSYELRVERPGFSRFVQTGITLAVDQAANLTVVMQVGQLTEEVTVQANTELVGTRNGTLGQLVDQQRVVELPLNGRMAQSLVFLAAGTVDLGRNGCRICGHGGVYPGEQTAGVNGAGMAQVNYQLDGAGHNDTYLNVNVPFPNPDAVQEFNLQASNFTAEYGNAAGGIVNIVTRSGTNQIRGSAFEFLRDGALNARNFFAPQKDTLKRNQFGGSAGGPILRDRMFYFGTYQGTRIRSEAAGRVAFVPTAAERAGDFSALSTQLVDPVTRQPFPNNQIPAARISPVAKYFLDWIPQPNRAGRELNFVGTEQIETENQFMAKVEYNRQRHQISGRYFFTDYDRPAVIPEDNILAASSAGNAVRVQNVSVNHTYSIRPTLLLHSTFGFNRQRGGSLSSGPFSYPDAGVRISSAASSALAAPPELVMSVTGAFSINTNHLGDFDRGDVTIRENLTAVLGPHEMHFGGEIVRLSNHITNTFRMDGNFTFSGQLSGDGLADFMLGRASSFVQGGGEFKDLKGTRWGFFAQDNWRANQRLTLNLGVRWDPYFPYYDREGRVVCFEPGAKSERYPNAPAGMLYGGKDHDPGCPVGGSEANIWNVAPRVGFAYRLMEDGKTSLRGGYGHFYTPIQASAFNPFTNIAPFAPGFSFSGVSFEDPFGSVGVRDPFPEQYGPRVPGAEATFVTPTELRAVFAEDFRTPLLMSWNLSLERQLGADWVARVAYIGNEGRYFFGAAENSREINPAIYIPGASTVANTQARRPYQEYSRIGLYESTNTSRYHSMQLNVEKRFARGLSVLASYTFSKKQDDYGWTTPDDIHFDWGLSREDVPHNFKFSNVWQLPEIQGNRVVNTILNGWMLNSMVTWQSGFPFTVSSGRDNSFTGIGRDRADFLGGDPDLGSDRPHGEMVAQYFDTSKFVANAIGTFGNSGKNMLRGPRYFNTDVALLKSTRIGGRVDVQFRAEFFNIFNNVNFNLPNSNVASAQFGRITSALDPRILQFGLKMLF